MITTDALKYLPQMGSRPLAGGRLCGGKVSELFRTGEWICRRGDRWREVLDRLLLFGWLLS